jgi:hypothetical protein
MGTLFNCAVKKSLGHPERNKRKLMETHRNLCRAAAAKRQENVSEELQKMKRRDSGIGSWDHKINRVDVLYHYTLFKLQKGNNY